MGHIDRQGTIQAQANELTGPLDGHVVVLKKPGHLGGVLDPQEALLYFRLGREDVSRKSHGRQSLVLREVSHGSSDPDACTSRAQIVVFGEAEEGASVGSTAGH
jgi:hypothetical protein